MFHTVAAAPKNRKPIGPYSKPHRLAKLDGRRREAKAMGEIRAELTRHVGAPSAVERRLIERAAVLHLRIELMDARAPDGAMTERDAREYLCWHNAFVRTIAQLGLKGVAPPAETLDQHLARLALERAPAAPTRAPTNDTGRPVEAAQAVPTASGGGI